MFYRLFAIVCLCVLVLLTMPAKAASEPVYYDDISLTRADLVSVYDGDTFKVTIPNTARLFGEEIPVRLRGLDTPEMRSSCPTTAQKEHEKFLANEAKVFLENRLTQATFILLTQTGRDMYYRVDAIVFADGVNVNQALIDAGLARPYDGGTKQSWCQ